jgi:bifunctional non-homologous end joining protein LigD
MIIWDFDPTDGDFEKVRKGAFILYEKFMKHGIEPFLKTTGSRGLHVILPIEPEVSFLKTRTLAKKIADFITKENPVLLTTEFEISERGNKVFVDYLRNGFAQTAIAPFSVRARENAPISAPITWKQLESNKMHSQYYNIQNILPRLKKQGELFNNLHSKPYSLKEISKMLS